MYLTMIKKLHIIALSLVAAFITSCASMDRAMPYFEVSASVGTQQLLARAGADRPKYVALIREVAGIMQTLSTGVLLSPGQFMDELSTRIPASDVKDAVLPVVAGVYAVAYVDFKDRPELKNEYVNRIATILLANAN